MILKEYNENTFDFRNFLYDSSNGTIMSSQEFLNYHGDKFENRYLTFENKNKVVALLVGASVVENNIKKFISHPGASFGGFVTKNINFSDTEKIFDLFNNWMKENNFNYFKYKEPPADNLVPINDSLKYLFYRNEIKLVTSEISTFVNLKKSEDELFESFNKLTKRSLKKSSNMFFTKISKEKKDVKKFYKILEENLDNKYETLPTHNLKELKYLVSKLDEINLFLTYKNNSDELASGVLTVNLNRNTVLAFYIASNSKYLDHSPVRQSIYEAIKYSKEKNFKSFNFGISTEDSGKTVNKGLLKFKESFGGVNSLRNTFEYRI